MAEDDYAASGGSLKLKGAKGGRVEKKKKKKKSRSEPSKSDRPASAEPASPSPAKASSVDSKLDLPKEMSPGTQEVIGSYAGKTEAEIRHEEMRRKRLNERLKKEGVKTHKEKVEDLNKYLSNLSEHHDMPRIGPG
ncbi:MAG: hypothetical protein M1835_004369 [Candelina submexicana]|nr:MAG: hypothetical protein M1835_004369 [Candelina submexicana]